MEEIIIDTIRTERVFLPEADAGQVELSILRLDRIHPLISGNKWFKLRLYLEEARKLGKKRIITFGGAWSNHILATAAACQLNNFECTGIIRGEKPANLSVILQSALKMGMQLEFISREDYANNKIPPVHDRDDCYFIPQGGYGILGAKGAAGILDHCARENFTNICCAAGTGTMTAGLMNAALASQRVCSISVLKNNHALENDTRQLLDNKEQSADFIHDFHFGGYAKYDSSLIRFMNDLFQRTTIPTDFVYTGKLCYAVSRLCKDNFFKTGSRILIIHSGGLSGNASLKKGTLIF